MQHLDRDIEEAFEDRERLIDSMLAGEREESRRPWYRPAISSIRDSQIIVWEPTALEAFERNWESTYNYKLFRDRCLAPNGIRYVPQLLESVFHFFPAGGIAAPPDFVPVPARNATYTSVYQPNIRSVAIGHEVPNRSYVPAILEVVHIDPAYIPPGSWDELRHKLETAPPREQIYCKGIRGANQSLSLEIKDGKVINVEHSISWVSTVYQLRMFLEQPYLGHIHHKHRVKSKATGKWTEHDIVKIIMRAPPKHYIPRIQIPLHSRLHGRPLGFEIDVREHVRHCASGVVTNVKAHKRGPAGVTRPKVLKVIR